MPPSTASSSSLLQQDYHPSRRVKRLRELALKEPSQSSAEFHLSMLAPVTDASQSRQQSPPPAAAPRRRGRKPSGPLSKSAREQLRKTNHSVIEKRRREKINEALAALRELVPNEKAHDPEKKDKEDKEFKLEILVRTVDYLRSVVDKMNTLEQGLCRKCGGGLILPPGVNTSTSFSTPLEKRCSSSVDYEQERCLERKRKVSEVEDDPAADDPESDFDDEPSENYDIIMPTNVAPRLDAFLENANADAGSDRLPSISSWLPGSVTSSPILQLPSPPQSVPFAPTTMATGALPGLALPPPIGFPSYSTYSTNSNTTRSASAPSPVACSPNIAPTTYGHGHAISRILNPTGIMTLPASLPSPTSPYPIPELSFKGGDLPRSTSPFSLSGGHRDREAGSPSQVRPSKKWSGDEHTAASLLLNMSSRRYSSGSASDDNSTRNVLFTRTRNQDSIQAQTPSSLLGMPPGAHLG